MTKQLSQNRLSSSILNYYAAFTETKFNFQRGSTYRWSNDELTLDFQIFPSFEKSLIELVSSGSSSSLSIKKGQYTVAIPAADILNQVDALLSTKFTKEFLIKCIKDSEASLRKDSPVFIGSEDGTVKKADTKESPDAEKNLQNNARKEGSRSFCLGLRRALDEMLMKMQEKIISDLQKDIGLEHAPPSIFNSNQYLQDAYDALLSTLSSNTSTSAEAHKSLMKWFKDKSEDIVIYDLFFNVQKYHQYESLGTLYLFFHELVGGEGQPVSYPLYFIAADIRLTDSEVEISFPRPLLYLNTPAINSYKFPTVLTTPRACSIQVANQYLNTIETFIQTHYGWNKPFILEKTFRPILPKEEGHPQVRCRIGMQVVKNEDKSLLDYSELLTRLEGEGTSQFTEYIDQYINGNVPNTQSDIDDDFRKEYGQRSTKRYIPDGPIPLNTSQKRIILALNNKKNRTIVVDGPPGTGKSHTIAAISYWANQENKSLVVTSHKQEALDVIERMLEDKFHDLHPKAKPSLIRFANQDQSENSFQNTLQTVVVNSANERVNEYNESAVEQDSIQKKEQLVKLVQDQLEASLLYPDMMQKIVLIENLQQSLINDEIFTNEDFQIPKPVSSISIDFFKEVEKHITNGLFGNFSLEELRFIMQHRSKLSEFLMACESLHEMPEQLRNVEVQITQVPEKLVALIEDMAGVFITDVEIKTLTPNKPRSGILTMLSKKAPSVEVQKEMITELKSLKQQKVLEAVSSLQNEKDYMKLTLGEIQKGLEQLDAVIAMQSHRDLLAKYRALPEKKEATLKDIYSALSVFSNSDFALSEEFIFALEDILQSYKPLLNKVGVEEGDLSSLQNIQNTGDKANKLWEWIKLHATFPKQHPEGTFTKKSLDEYLTQKQKQVEHINDIRLKNLSNHLGDIARMVEAYKSGRRLTIEQSKVLLDHIACVIASPQEISKYFPMEEDMIDILVIDEASQVSIAHSISLILRAKQVVIFGDEYQYGAVSAVNVSSRYSKSYFQPIIHAYRDSSQQSITEKQEEELLSAVSDETSEDEQMVQEVLSPGANKGKMEWLKTFDIRTSTLSFSKAIANYTTSLRDHYRSFPVIIDYSNQFFYKPAQIELTPNRIRTKPIGEVLQFIKVETKGNSGPNINLDEIDAIIEDMQQRIDNGFTGTIGIISSFREQNDRMLATLNERMNMPQLRKKHKIAIWFVGDVQGEERDLIYYSFVQDKKYDNANLTKIYPVIGGAADNIRSLKMQRLNVGFSRAKDTMIFVHSMPIEEYSNSRLGDSLKHYCELLEKCKKCDFFIEDESVFGSPAEKDLYQLLLQTAFVQKHRENVQIIPQFNIGQYLQEQFAAQLPKYRVDFLVVFSKGGKEQTLILEYDGIEFHYKDPKAVTSDSFSQEYIDYDVSRQLELESYGYRFLRINKFTLIPESKEEDRADVLNRLLVESFTS